MLPPPSELTIDGTSFADRNERVACEHADRCGGCPILALPYGEQLAMKRGRVVQSVGRYPSLELVYTEPVVAAEPHISYRTRAKLIVAPGGKIGLFAKGGGHQVVDIPNCRVISPPLARVAETLRALIMRDEATTGPLAPFDAERGALRAADLREVRDGDANSARVLVTFVVQRARVGSLDALHTAAKELAETMPIIAGIAANFHEGDAPQILGGETQVLWGAATMPDRLGASTHLATFGSFVQAHRGQAERVHTILADALIRGDGDEPPKIVDLYGGSGAIALGLAASGANVHLVESFAPATANARAAAAAQNLPLETECADVANALRSMNERGAHFDAAVVNPPRRGMSANAREGLARLGPNVIAYVSCDPDTLARDLDHFVRLGYSTASLRPLDMIPLTEEVETVAILRRGAIPLPRVAYEDDDVVIVEKGAHEPTTPQPDYIASLIGRARRLHGAEEAVPVHRLDVGTSGLVILVRRPSLAAAWTDALAAQSARKIYVAATRGVTPTKGAITRELRDDGKLVPARTRYRRLAVVGGHSVLRVIPEQGRTHQIRRHLAAIGHPALGDERYGHAPTNRFFEEKHGLDRAFLHCVRIELDHPATGKRLIVEAPLPGDLRAVLERSSGPGTLRFLDHKNALGTSGFSSIPPPPDSFHDIAPPPDTESSITDLPVDDSTDEGNVQF